MWRNHHEEALKKKTDELNQRILQAEASVEETKEKLIADTQGELRVLMEQLKMARAEMQEANISLREASSREQELINASVPAYISPSLEVEEFQGEVELDMPKSAKDYVPEGTYFTGYLLGGLVVSTALNTAEENAVPLTIILKSRGNLAKENPMDISQCKILASAYGDLSSERAVIRLEKMTCYRDGMYITSNIAGDVHGPDGFNGIKGTVISTSSKHLKNAAIGGLLSGLSSSAKGQDGVNLSSGGLVSTKSKGFKDMATGGLMSGVSNAGDKLAEYYLRQAESMSPVLTISGGVRVNAHITKGFFIGEVGTHRKIKAARNNSKNKNISKAVQNKSTLNNGSDDGWR